MVELTVNCCSLCSGNNPIFHSPSGASLDAVEAILGTKIGSMQLRRRIAPGVRRCARDQLRTHGQLDDRTEAGSMLTRREALTAAALGAAALATDVPAAWAHDHAIPGVRGMDHVGITVPDIAEARALVRGRHRLPDAAPLRAVQRPDGHVHAGPARGGSARGHPRDQRAALRDGLEHRAVRVHLARPGHAGSRGTPTSAATTSRSTSRTSTSPSPTWSPRACASCSGRSP